MIFIEKKEAYDYEGVVKKLFGGCTHMKNGLFQFKKKNSDNAYRCSLCGEFFYQHEVWELNLYWGQLVGLNNGENISKKILDAILQYGTVELYMEGHSPSIRYIIEGKNIYSGKGNLFSNITYIGMILYEYLIDNGVEEEEVRRIFNGI